MEQERSRRLKFKNVQTRASARSQKNACKSNTYALSRAGTGFTRANTLFLSQTDLLPLVSLIKARLKRLQVHGDNLLALPPEDATDSLLDFRVIDAEERRSGA